MYQACSYGRGCRIATVSIELNAPAVMVNDQTAFQVDWMLFGGRGTFSLGIGSIHNSNKLFTNRI